MKHVCDAERCCIMEKFEELHGTLNGWPAVIRGRKLDCPTVWALRTDLHGGETMREKFSWGALRRAVRTGKVNLRT